MNLIHAYLTDIYIYIYIYKSTKNEKRPTTLDKLNVKCSRLSAPLSRQHTNYINYTQKNTHKLKHYTKLKHYIYKKGLLEFKSTFSVVNFNTHLIIVKAIERINKRPPTRGLGLFPGVPRGKCKQESFKSNYGTSEGEKM